MIYVTVWFKDQAQSETKEFHNRITALRFMYGIRRKGHIIINYYADDPEDTEWINRRFK